MSFGKPNNNSAQKALSFKIKVKDLPAPIFEVKQRDEDGKWGLLKTKDAVTYVAGDLVAIEAKENEWDGDIIRSVSVSLMDNDEIYFVTIPCTNTGRNLMNSFAALKSFDKVSISLYMSKPSKKDGKTYPSACLRQDDALVKGKFSQEDLPSPEEVIFKGKTQRDFSACESFLLEQIKELTPLVKDYSTSRSSSQENPSSQRQDTTTSGNEHQDPDVEANEDDDVPF